MHATSHPSLVTIGNLVKSRKSLKIVIPAKAGIQVYEILTKCWTPVFTGVTDFLQDHHYSLVTCYSLPVTIYSSLFTNSLKEFL
jgi:hypothetical protein